MAGGGASGAAALVDANNGYMDVALWQGVMVTHSIVASSMPRFSNYAMVETEVPVEYSQNIWTTSTLKFDPSGLGDFWGDTKILFALPAIQRNSSAGALWGRGNDAYWVNNFGYAAIQELDLLVGQQVAITAIADDLFDWYQNHHPNAALPIDVDIGRYTKECQLKRAAQCNQVLSVPLMMSVFRAQRTDRHFPLLRFFNQSVHLQLQLRSLLNVTVNENALSLVPYKYGTTTPVANADVGVRLFSTFLIMNTDERNALAMRATRHIVLQSQTMQQVSTDAAGRLVTIQPTFNHTCRSLRVFFLPDKYIDGSTRSPNGVGLKNYFDYTASHGGESGCDINLKFNSTAVIDNQVPPVILRSNIWAANYLKPNYGSKYLIPFQRRLLSDDLNHGVNFSGIDKVAIEVRKNVGDSGTFFVQTDNVNLIATVNGYGGVPFSG